MSGFFFPFYTDAALEENRESMINHKNLRDRVRARKRDNSRALVHLDIIYSNCDSRGKGGKLIFA